MLSLLFCEASVKMPCRGAAAAAAAALCVRSRLRMLGSIRAADAYADDSCRRSRATPWVRGGVQKYEIRAETCMQWQWVTDGLTLVMIFPELLMMVTVSIAISFLDVGAVEGKTSERRASPAKRRWMGGLCLRAGWQERSAGANVLRSGRPLDFGTGGERAQRSTRLQRYCSTIVVSRRWVYHDGNRYNL